MAQPCRCAASLGLLQKLGNELPRLWLSHADARQGSDCSRNWVTNSLAYGSAMPMRGKSPTCRRVSLFLPRSLTAINLSSCPASLRLAAHQHGRAINETGSFSLTPSSTSVHRTVFGARQSQILERVAVVKRKILNVVKNERGNSGSVSSLDVPQFNGLSVINNKWRARVVLEIADADIVHLQPAHVTNKKSVRRNLAKHGRLGIIVLF